MSKLLKGLAAATAVMWAGSAQAAYYSFSFYGFGTGFYGESNRDNPSPIPNYQSGDAVAYFGITVEENQLFGSDSLGPYSLGLTDHSLSAWASSSAEPYYYRSLNVLANFAANTFSGLPSTIDMSKFLDGTMTLSENTRDWGRSFNGQVTRVSVTRTEAADWIGAGFSMTFVPEPASWAMMLVGFGAIGATLRRRPLHRQALAARHS